LDSSGSFFRFPLWISNLGKSSGQNSADSLSDLKVKMKPEQRESLYAAPVGFRTSIYSRVGEEQHQLLRDGTKTKPSLKLF